MKKFVLLFLAAIMLLSFVSCGDDSSDGSLDNITFEELVVVDDSECVIKIKEVTEGSSGYVLKVELENKSGDKSYLYSVDGAAVNGVQCDVFFYETVSSGKKSNKSFNISKSSFKETGLTKATDIELTFSVSDSDDFMSESIVTKTVHVYPYGADKAVKYERAPKDTDNVIVDNEYITVTVTGYDKGSSSDFRVKLYIVNKTDKQVMLSADEVSVNGYMLEPYFAQIINPKMCSFSSIVFSKEGLADNDITSVEEIEFMLTAYDFDDWFGDDFVNKTVVLNP